MHDAPDVELFGNCKLFICNNQSSQSHTKLHIGIPGNDLLKGQGFKFKVDLITLTWNVSQCAQSQS